MPAVTNTTSCPRCGKSGQAALADQGPLKLRHGDKQIKMKHACGGGGINLLSEQAKANLTFGWNSTLLIDQFPPRDCSMKAHDR